MSLDGRVLGEFTLREKIGEGGFAVVYRAEQTALEREAVVKVLHQRLVAREDVTRRFLREARLATRLDHPYAAHVYAFGAEPDGTLWIAMELVRGTPMDRWLESKGPLALEQLVPLFERICEVVQTAHDRGIIHRDLKPGNVMILARAGRLLPKLLDFGIARALDDSEPAPPSGPAAAPGSNPDTTMEWIEAPAATPDATRAGTALGSPAYMAPEQWADASSAGPAADVYALGVLMFEALTGRQPFTGDSAVAIMTAHVHASPPPLGAGFPPALDAALARALAKSPHERPASASEFAAAVRAASGLGEPEHLAQLAEPLRDAMTAAAPQPLAEAIAALEAARNVDQACALVVDIVMVAVRWIGILALAARTRTGSGGHLDHDDVLAHLRTLGRGELDTDGWLELARLLTRPFARKRDAHPLPELVALLHGLADVTPAEPPLAPPPLLAAYQRSRELRGELDRRAGRTADERRALYADALDATTRLLEPLRALLAYTVVAPRGGRKERWRGPRRHPRPAIAGSAPLPDGQVFLVDGDGEAVLRLSPLVQLHRPAPGKDEELFVLDGRDADGARLVAVPYGYARHDPALADWLRRQFGLADADDTAAPTDANPYRGLAPFTVEDAGFYVGREREVEAFVNLVRAEPLLAVVGPSGAGKSSFVQAGVVPRLPAGWRAIVVRPGAAPLATLAARLQREGLDVGDLADDPAALAVALREAGGNLVLVVDQLEELFTLCRDDRARQRYAAALAEAARSSEDPIRVIVTLRDDFLARCDTLDALRSRIPYGLVLLGTPGPDELERIVVEPARRAGYELEDRALAGEIVDAVAGQPGALALLSFTAAELWKLRDRHFHQLTRKAYTAIGGVVGALARHAEDTLAALPGEDARLVREAFRHLVTSEGTRQVVTMTELRQLLARTPGSTEPRAIQVIDRLIAARLLVASEDIAGEDRVEVIHEALFAAWPRLATWRREDAEGARLRDQLRVAARQWHVRDRPRGLLWRADALAEYRIWRARYPGSLTDVEEAFAAASVADAARSQRLRRALLATAFVVLAGGLAITLYLRGEAASAQRLAESNEAKIETQLRDSHVLRGRQALLGGDTTTAIEALTEAGKHGAIGPAFDLMMARAKAPLEAEVATLAGGGKIDSVEFSPDGTRLLTAAGDGSTRIWDAARGTQLHVLSGKPGERTLAAWRPDGSVVAIDASGTLRVWSDGKLVGQSADRAGSPYRIASRGDGTIATEMQDGRLAIWDVAGKLRASWESVGLQNKFDVEGIALDPIRDRILTNNSTGTSVIWTLAGKRLFELKGHEGAVWHGAYDPRGRWIVTASHDKTARIWDAETGTLLHVLEGHERRATHIAIDRSGRFVATASADTTVRVWDLESGKSVATLRGHRAQVNWVVFAGDQLVSVGADGAARVWDFERGLEIATFAPGGFVMPVVVAPDGRWIATVSGDRAKVWDRRMQTRIAALDHPVTRAQLPVPVLVAGSRYIRLGNDGLAAWDLRTRAPSWHRAIPTLACAGLAGTVLVTGTASGELWHLDASDGAIVRKLANAGKPPLAIAVHPDGLQFATSDGDGIAIVDLRTGERVAQRRLARIDTLRFLPDGATLIAHSAAFADASYTVWLLDRHLATRAELHHRGVVNFVEASPDGSTLATSSENVVHIWSRAGQSIVELVHGNLVGPLQWIDGDHVVTSTARGSIAVWNTRGDRLREITAHEAYLTSLAINSDGRFLATAGGDHVVRLWELDTLAPILQLHSGNDLPTHLSFHSTELVASTRMASDVWRLLVR